MSVNIRPWEPSDEQACNEAFRESYVPLLEECPDDYRPVASAVVDAVANRAFASMTEYFASKDRQSAWVAESGDDFAGYVDAWFNEPGVGYIGNIFVVPAFRRHDLATRLMDVAEGYLAELGAEELTLRSAHALVEAHGLYLKRGYRLTETVAAEQRREITYLHFAKPAQV